MSDYKLGKKVDLSRPVITPDWTPMPGKPHIWRHKDGKLKNTQPDPPEAPRAKTPAEEFFEMFAAHSIQNHPTV